MAVGQILWGSNNIFYVQVPEISVSAPIWECRIRGKRLVLDDSESYNPLSPGDFVEVSAEQGDKGSIVSRMPRKNSFVRWNKKRQGPQTLASNIDTVCIVAATGSPPFRPRFIDRCIVACERSGIEAMIVINKVDLGISDEDESRILDYRRMGYRVLLCSVTASYGLEELREGLRGALVAFVGQSGVGKSSLISALEPAAKIRIGALSQKYDRGTHTTTLARTYPVVFARGLIDTPGVREMELPETEIRDIASSFRDFEKYLDDCEMRACSHREEAGCAVKAAVETGAIHPDRYESYLRIVEGLR